MKNRIASFTGGFFAALALSLCLTTALAAAGQVSYNFANVSMDGTQKITAGQDITAANEINIAVEYPAPLPQKVIPVHTFSLEKCPKCFL